MSRKMRRLRSRRLELARAALNRHTEVTASDFIHHLPELLARLRSTPPIFLYPRVSTEKQSRNGNLDDLTEWSLLELRKLGLSWPRGGIYECVESSHIQDERPILKRIIADARAAGGIVVAPFRDRFIRHEYFDGTNWSDEPTAAEYLALMRMATGVPLATLFHPDRRSRMERTLFGIRAKGANVGRPPKPGYMKRRRQKLEADVLKLTDSGLSQRDVAATLGLPRTTVQRWIFER